VLNQTVALGDLLLAYSDGVIEAQSPSGEFFGEERLRSVIMSCPGEPEQASDHVLSALEDFTSGSKPYDDLTLIAARRTGE
jgi:two-component system response regulator